MPGQLILVKCTTGAMQSRFKGRLACWIGMVTNVQMGCVVNWIGKWYVITAKLNGFILGAVLLFDIRTTTCLEACIG